MATYNKFNQFTLDLINGVHDFDANVFKVYLSNTAPVATNSVKADIPEISSGNGYTTGGNTTTITTSTATGTAKVVGTDPTTWTSTGTMGPFRYAILYNDSSTTPLDPLIAWWDYGSSVTLNLNETFTVDFDPSTGIFTIT